MTEKKKKKRTSRRTEENAVTTEGNAEEATQQVTSKQTESEDSVEVDATEESASPAIEDAVGAKPSVRPKAGLTTDNMPGSIVLPTTNTAQTETSVRKVRVFRDDELGSLARDVATKRPMIGRSERMLTFAPGCVYCLVLIDGRASVPQKIADFISKENPGDSLRLV